MDQQIKLENAIRGVEEEFEAAAAVLEVKLYEVKMAGPHERLTSNG
jgi:hypothetical protein